MSTPYSFETVFAAPSAAVVLAAYFDPDHLAAQDKVGELIDRTVIEDTDGELERKAAWTVRAMRPLPVFARPFVEGGRLSYVEKLTWRKRDNRLDLSIVPQVLGGRVSVAAVYELTDVGEWQVRRRYSGQISVDIRFVGGKVERGILEAIEDGMPKMRDCTQNWLTAKYPR